MVEARRVGKGVCCVVGVVAAAVSAVMLVAFIRALTLEDLDYQETALDLGERDNLPQSYLRSLPKVMARALSIPTVASSPGNYDVKGLERFHDFLRESFPNVFNSSMIEVEVVNKLSLLLTIKGVHDDMTPYLLMGHMDVVPVDKDKWTHDPWGGHILQDPATGESFIWGRGAIDCKFTVMSILMALEYLAKTGFQPERSFYVAFGHDEEVGGGDGARHIALLLESRRVRLDFILDEGLPVVEDLVPGMPQPVAPIGVTEKGHLTVELEVEGPGGHSSIPPSNSAVTRLAKALVALENYPQPSMFGKGPEADMLSFLAPKATWPHRLVFANLWLFKPILELVFSRKRETNALIRTTTSVTIVRAGVKENVVPASATAIVNHRIHPAQSIRDVIQHDKDVIADPSIKVNLVTGQEAHPVSSYGPEVPAWRLLTAAIHHHFPEVITAPAILVGNTDTKHYLNLTTTVYRFYPMMLPKDDLAVIHGTDERISVANLLRSTGFYHRIMVWGARWL